MIQLQFFPEKKKFLLSAEAKFAKKKFLQEKSELGFAQLPYREAELLPELKKLDSISPELNTYVVIGIGGSDLGARAIVNALVSLYQRKIYFCGDTTDPKSLYDLTQELDITKTLFIVISKSGNTIEQAASFIYFRDLVTSKLGATEVTKHFLLLTDPASGALRKLANEHGYSTISHPVDVGGRYSVLSTVGMTVAYLLGLEIDMFLQGARKLADLSSSAAEEEDLSLAYADWQYMESNSGKNITVFMPYEYGLTEFSRWFKQLWAESLGKKLDNDKLVVNNGTTPVQAIGPVDQHSQLQLFNEGPNDKNFTFVIAEKADNDISLPADLTDLPDFNYLSGRSMHDLLIGEFKTTRYALHKNGRSTCTITVPEINEYWLGALFYFFEQAVVYLGYMNNIDPFDQPGVELSKNVMFGLLGKSGYENYKDEYQSYVNKDLGS